MSKILSYIGLIPLLEYQSLEAKYLVLIREVKESNEKNKDEILKLNIELENYREVNESFLKKSKLITWSIEIRKVGICDICSGTEELTAHHLWSKSLFPQLAYQFDNGVCLCNECHKAFHRKYKCVSQITPKKYLNFKVFCKNQIDMFGSINYDNF